MQPFSSQNGIVRRMDEDILSTWHIHHPEMLMEMIIASFHDPVLTLGYTRNPCVVVFPGELDTVSKKTALVKNLTGCPAGRK